MNHKAWSHQSCTTKYICVSLQNMQFKKFGDVLTTHRASSPSTVAGELTTNTLASQKHVSTSVTKYNTIAKWEELFQGFLVPEVKASPQEVNWTQWPNHGVTTSKSNRGSKSIFSLKHNHGKRSSCNMVDTFFLSVATPTK